MDTQSKQAERIIAKFGGAIKLAKLLGITKQAVYRWSYPVERRGTGGLVASSSVAAIKRLAIAEGVTLTAEDWAP